jgi:hypothetical protein
VLTTPHRKTYPVTECLQQPGLAFSFPKLKTTLKGRRIKTIDEIQENAITDLRAITESAFLEAFEQWKKRVSPVDGTTLKGTVLKML